MAYMNGNETMNYGFGGNVTVVKGDIAQCANALKQNKSGENVVMQDVSPIEHTIACKVSGENVSAVKVIKAGLNLLKPYVAEATKSGVTARLSADGFIETSGTFESATVIDLTMPSGYIQDVLPAGTYCAIKEHGGIVANTIADIFFGASYVDGSGNFNIDSAKKTATSPFVITRVYAQIKTEAGANMRFPAMLHLASASNVEFEEYKELETYAVNADGTVESLKPYYPNTTLFADTAGATLDVTYNRDINKAFAELQSAIISLGGNV